MPKTKDPAIGAKIVAMRPMTEEEMNREGWFADIHGSPTVIVLDNGTILYPSRDPEGNGAGALFGCTKEGKTIAFY